MKVILLVIVVSLLVSIVSAKGKKSTTSFASAFGYADKSRRTKGTKGKKERDRALVAIPRKKGDGGRGVMMSMSKIGGGLITRVAREMRSQFSSELEALTLQLTRPTNAPILGAASNELISFFNSEYDNPQVVVSILAKLSRKLCEPNVYTKLKALLAVNRLVANTSGKGLIALSECMKSLQQETDSKVGLPFFSVESVERAKGIADSVGEIEMAELATEYAAFMFVYIDAKAPVGTLGHGSNRRGSKKSGKKKVIDSMKLEMESASKVSEFVEAIRLADRILDMGSSIKASKNKKSLVYQIVESVKSEKIWLGIQLQKAHARGSVSSTDCTVPTGEVEALLANLGLDYEPLLGDGDGDGDVNIDRDADGDADGDGDSAKMHSQVAAEKEGEEENEDYCEEQDYDEEGEEEEEWARPVKSSKSRSGKCKGKRKGKRDKKY